MKYLPSELNGGKILCSTNSAETIGYPHYKTKMNFNSHVALHTKITLKWIIDINIKCETVKVLENVGEILVNFSWGNFS